MNKNIPCPTLTLAAIVLLGAVLAPNECLGGPIFTLDTLMEVQSQEQILIQLVVPWGPTDTVSYGYTYDNLTGAFSFATVPGQSIAGLPFSLSTTANFSPTAQIWTWSGSGLIDGTSFQILGNVSIFGDPTEMITGLYHDDKEVEYTATADVTITEDERNTKSAGTGKATDKAGKVVKSGRVTNRVAPDEDGKGHHWEITFLNADLKELGAGGTGNDRSISPSIFEGQFVQSSASVPEPSSAILLGIASLMVFVLRGRGLRGSVAS